MSGPDPETDHGPQQSQQRQPPLYVNIAHFSICSDAECPFETTEETHLLINKQRVDIAERSNAAVALSYAWGHFEHTERLLGHTHEGKPMHVVLGAEWNTGDFSHTLVRLSAEQGGCWIDQLCMPQKDEEEVRKTLSSIPSVYRTLDVVVLFPGAPCKCLREQLDEMNRAKEDGTYEEYMQARPPRIIDTLHDSCMNIIPVSSWFTRVWTRQEMIYARRIKVVWTKVGVSPCAEELDLMDGSELAEELDRFSPFLRLQQREHARSSYDTNYAPIFDKGLWFCLRHALRVGTVLSRQHFLMAIYISAGRLKSAIYKALTRRDSSSDPYEGSKQRALQKSNRHGCAAARTSRGIFLQSAVWAFMFWTRRDEGWTDLTVEHEIYLFFAGEQLTVPPPRYPDLKRNPLRQFLYDLEASSSSARSCTQPKDYVNSVWADCPDYVLRTASMKAKLPTLLDDALSQLRLNHGCAPVTSAPSGVFGAQVSTGLWVPSKYLLEDEVHTDGDVYKPIQSTVSLPITNTGSIPLRLTGQGGISLSDMAVDYETEYGKLSTKAAWEMIHRIARAWSVIQVPNRLSYLTGPTGVRSAREEQAVKENRSVSLSAILHNVKTLAGFLYRTVFKVLIAGGSPLSSKAFAEEANHPGSENENLDREAEFVKKIETSVGDEEPPTDYAWIKKDLDHGHLLYIAVSRALGLWDWQVCRVKGLRLMVSLASDPPCIGFAHPDFFRIWKGRKETVTRTVRVLSGLMYEVVQVPGTGMGGEEAAGEQEQYRVFGVWVPVNRIPKENVYAEVKRGASDAFII
ncbi:uncharacterized protein DSM5745_00689 [Aspergillus mulundensis]|uniref:Heterokaryon incompatibility domain-containing protein n=1 Tax=Aspergillus mulundensis TaxID=1810919 RepID=A0A3D8T483_9EURO|nr:hypothetical protein DSM5745_00689 [Aspergillus mulundensis]RDW93367.1 hypothetical protein DSM5745_00689 [Aspergillus mulundensis]